MDLNIPVYWLKQKRLDKKLTQSQISTHANITLRYYQYLEKGNMQPSVDVAKKIAEILDFNWTEFFQKENE